MTAMIPPLRSRTRMTVAVLGLASLFWLLYCPDRPDRVYRAMPANAVLVSEHRDLAAVWRDRMDNPLLIQPLAACGVDGAVDLAANTNAIWIVRLVSGRHTLIGWSPSIGPTASPAWVAASWVGLRGRLMQALLAIRWVPGLGRLERTAAGVRYLPLESRHNPRLTLAFALRENVLMAALGDDPDAVATLDLRLHRDAAPAAVYGSDAKPWRGRGGQPHRAWVDPDGYVPAGVAPLPMRVDLETVSTHALRLVTRLATSPSWRTGPALVGRSSMADARAGNRAKAMLFLPGPPVAAALAGSRSDLLPAAGKGAEDACLYLTAPPHGGRLFGLGIPAITLAVPWESDRPGDVAATVAGTLGHGAGLPLTLRPLEPPVPGQWRLDAGRLSRYLGEDGPRLDARLGWVVCGTSGAAIDASAAPATEAAPSWRPLLESAAASGAHGCLWIDLQAVAGQAQQVAAVYRLATALGGLRVTAEEEERAQSLIASIAALEPFATLQASLAPDADGDGVALRIDVLGRTMP